MGLILVRGCGMIILLARQILMWYTDIMLSEDEVETLFDRTVKDVVRYC